MTTEQTHIAFLRAVNVGARKVEMARLRETLSGLGLGAVRTYIASGNAFFTTAETDRVRLTASIEAALAKTFGFDIPAIVRTVPELRAELAASPFTDLRPAPDERFSLVFASGPLAHGTLPPRSPRGDWEVLDVCGGTASVRWRLRGGRTVNPAPVIEKTFGVTATARFFHTTQKILAVAES
ncbi:DUF1697 domain-containing protein [Streptomyces sp. NPDC028635]|uniref:DUF1697 domain-containing protein n=1 Tax=Streptomyces sp. NPDC028635 TaxID=3154800 RepID=UPI0033C3D101